MENKKSSLGMNNCNKTLIQMRDVKLDLGSKAGKVEILKGVSLDITSDTTVAITGPSGAGKSTLMMIIGGLEGATSGSIIIDNENFGLMNEDSLAEFRRDNIGIVFQAFRLIPTMTALENVSIPLELSNDPNAGEKARHALDLVGLSERMDHYPDQLSGGEQQRVAVARAFITNPVLLLADEPTGNLDQETGNKIIDLLFGLRSSHKTTLILVTHDRSLAQRCDRIIDIADGQIQSDINSSD
ncbi:MAG: ABC transporter ATP-binding protein [Thalassobaculaceae bacterium]